MKTLTADRQTLQRQVNDLLSSNIKEGSKAGLHNLLGEILDSLEEKDCVVISEYRERRA